MEYHYTSDMSKKGRNRNGFFKLQINTFLSLHDFISVLIYTIISSKHNSMAHFLQHLNLRGIKSNMLLTHLEKSQVSLMKHKM